MTYRNCEFPLFFTVMAVFFENRFDADKALTELSRRDFTRSTREENYDFPIPTKSGTYITPLTAMTWQRFLLFLSKLEIKDII